MKKLVILWLDDEAVIGSVIQKEKGQIVVRAVEPTIEQELKEKIAELTKKPLKLKTGKLIKMENGGTKHMTLAKNCISSDKNYLYALADVINLNKIVIGGFRVRSFVVEEK